MRRLRFAFLTLLLATASGCERSTGLAGLSEEEFVSAMAALRRIERDVTLDSATKATARVNTLQERNLTPPELEAAARALAGDPERALTVWSRIDSLATAEPGVQPEEAELDTVT
ncbi:MAG TPA: hypothetical protein VK922_04050 [Gemmatimonadaceae bacterium]|nr:hypothetical protein [Gemmatimonadaceae bacterium]